LNNVTDANTATAYSVSQQLVSTAWSIVMGIVLLIWVFGWAGGKALVSESYDTAKVKVAEQKAAREAASAAKSGT
jgi:glucose-6-phosphate-specific signal transduction histidine kinase